MKITILTLFPEMFSGPFSHSIIKHAEKNKLADIKLVNIRDFGIGKHKIVDDKPYGGGVGMVLRVDVLEKAIEKAKDKLSKRSQKVILLDARGKGFNQKRAKEFSGLRHLILVCGHYEGVDERINKFIDGKISVGSFITTGGEIPAMLITDSVVRLIKNVLKKEATENESFSISPDYLEHPQYTKPRTYKNLRVPKILLSGNHKEVRRWREKHSLTFSGLEKRR
ncbi:tRNA (guanosine(37)-N1)-methyltransferase TrmD [Patescibacteria group bacterium]|nr:tRNA (guanosine(37)-N1)-methyltransferase TrmD [Patescibacteria group bacterium]MCL5010334.1 tRNA (guanosine(37)-N1)-methyltransferase TrmD [Patescibacteria group bacterium]